MSKLNVYTNRFNIVLLLLTIIDSHIFKKPELSRLYILGLITNRSEHFNLYRYSGITNKGVICFGIIYSYYQYLRYYQSNLEYIYTFITAKLLYIYSIFYKNTFFNTISYILLSRSAFLLHRTSLR